MSLRRLDLLVAGELNPDAIVLAETIEPEYGQVEQLVSDGVLTIGSSGAIVACGAARLGMRTGYVGVVGDDAAGHFMLSELRRRGVDIDGCRVEAERRTGLTVILSKTTDRAILTSPGTMADLTDADVGDELLGSSRHLHVSSPHLLAGLRRCPAAAVRQGARCRGVHLAGSRLGSRRHLGRRRRRCPRRGGRVPAERSRSLSPRGGRGSRHSAGCARRAGRDRRGNARCRGSDRQAPRRGGERRRSDAGSASTRPAPATASPPASSAP